MTEKIYIKGRVITIKKIPVNFMRVHHADMFTKESKRVSKLVLKVQRMYVKKNSKPETTRGNKFLTPIAV